MTEKKGLTLDQKPGGEEDILDLDLDELTNSLEQDLSESEEEIIDLVDLVEKGEGADQFQEEDISKWLEESQSFRIEEGISPEGKGEGPPEAAPGLDKGTDMMDALSEELDLEKDEGIHLKEMMKEEGISDDDLGALFTEEPSVEMAAFPGDHTEPLIETLEVEDQEVSELDFEGVEIEGPEEEAELKPTPKGELTLELEGVLEGVADIDKEVAFEDAEVAEEQIPVSFEKIEGPREEAVIVAETISPPESQMVSIEAEALPPLDKNLMAETEEPPGIAEVTPKLPEISEEKIEALITRVVQDVVERVTRQVMGDVAERVITEAIESLKKSMETAADSRK